MGSLGETLRQARLDSGLSLAQAEQETRIRRKYLEALEAEELSSLPPPVYARGMARTYARYLGLDPTTIVDLYQARSREEPLFIRSATPRAAAPTPWPVKSVVLVASGALALVLLGLLWALYPSAAESLREVDRRRAEVTVPGGRGPGPGRAVASPAAEQPGVVVIPSPPATPTLVPTPIEGILIEARTSALTWIEAWVDGQKVVAEEVAPGQTRTFTATRSVRMRVSNGATVLITQNGQISGPLDASGRPAEAVWSRG